MLREIKDPKHPVHYLLPLLKCPIVKWFCSVHTCINFHLAKLFAVDVILCHAEVLEILVCNFGVCYSVIK